MDNTVLITGATSDIGVALAHCFAKHHYNVIIHYHKSLKKALNLEQDLIKKYGIKTLIIKADIAKEDEVKKMIEVTIDHFSKIDVLINNAAYYIDNNFLEKKVTDFKQVLNVNVLGTYLVSKYTALEMQKEQNGTIINIASTNGINTMQPYSADYDASKAGIISLTHNLAKELAPNIRVNALALGWVETAPVLKMNPNILKEEKNKILLQRFATPKEVADVTFFLASEDASYINSSVIRVDGGEK